jgi:hypothetical protein
VNGGHYPGSIEGDRYFTRRALTSIRNHPAVYAWYSLQKVAWYWIGHPSADWFGGSVLSPYALTPYWPWWEVVMIMTARILPLVALAAVWILRSRWRELLPVYALLAFFTLVHALTWAELRLSEPLAPYLVILVAGAAVRVCQAVVVRQSRVPAPQTAG